MHDIIGLCKRLWINKHFFCIPSGIENISTRTKTVLHGGCLVCRSRFNWIAGQDDHIITLLQQQSAEGCSDHSGSTCNQYRWHGENFYKNTSTMKITINKKPHKNGAGCLFWSCAYQSGFLPSKKVLMVLIWVLF